MVPQSKLWQNCDSVSLWDFGIGTLGEGMYIAYVFP